MAPSYPSDPAFPHTVPTAPLSKISLPALAAGDAKEASRLFAATRDTGLFYLDLRGTPNGEFLLQDVDEMEHLAEKLHDIDDEEREYLRSTSTLKKGDEFGTAYEERGNMIVDNNGHEGQSEQFIVSKDDIVSDVDYLPTARILNKNRYLLHSYACLSHSILTVILNCLTSSLGLPLCTLADLHRLSARGGDVVRFTIDQLDNTKCVAPTLAEHRDTGTLALRFGQLDGLQMRPRGQGAEWESVRPLPEHAIVSVGDALATFTDGLLRSCPQRVVAPPGQQTGLLTCSVAYLMRPETQARMCNIGLHEMIPELKGEASQDQGLGAGVWQYQRAMAVSAGEGLVN